MTFTAWGISLGHMRPDQYPPNPYSAFVSAAEASQSDRVEFLHRTYQHLAGALLAFGVIELALLNTPGIEKLVGLMAGNGTSWMIVLALFMGVSWLANNWAARATAPHMAYLGLGLYVVAEAILFLPMMYIAAYMLGDPAVIFKAMGVTGLVFGGLTAYVLITKQDFDFLRSLLVIGSFAALGLIAVSLIFGMSLGAWFSVAMAVFASGAIAYQTSAIVRQYPTNQHVAASLALFASVVLLFFYILNLFTRR